MAISFAETSNNDLFLDGSGNIALAYDLDAVLFACKAAAETLLGECVYQTNIGIDYFNLVWSGSPNLRKFENALIAQLQSVANVTSVVNVSVTMTNNILNYSAVILTTFGQGNISGGRGTINVI